MNLPAQHRKEIEAYTHQKAIEVYKSEQWFYVTTADGTCYDLEVTIDDKGTYCWWIFEAYRGGMSRDKLYDCESLDKESAMKARMIAVLPTGEWAEIWDKSDVKYVPVSTAELEKLRNLSLTQSMGETLAACESIHQVRNLLERWGV